MTQNNNTDNFLIELMSNQRKNIPTSKKLQYNDLKRISKYITESIFDENKCSIWSGYITNQASTSKGTYVNFYYKRRKMALHRLLYINFVNDLSDDEYLKFSCANRGRCTTVHHMNKFKYQISQSVPEVKEIKAKTISTVKNINTSGSDDDLYVDFNN